jgi:hypothetical protein
MAAIALPRENAEDSQRFCGSSDITVQELLPCRWRSVSLASPGCGNSEDFADPLAKIRRAERERSLPAAQQKRSDDSVTWPAYGEIFLAGTKVVMRSKYGSLQDVRLELFVYQIQ